VGSFALQRQCNAAFKYKNKPGNKVGALEISVKGVVLIPSQAKKRELTIALLHPSMGTV
jgi:hypothetical protein